MSEWQPIETAPKDGTILLLWCVLSDGWAWPQTGRYRDRGWVESFDGYDLVEPALWQPIERPTE